jgi:hypothetical protein
MILNCVKLDDRLRRPFAMHTTPRSQVSNSSYLFDDKTNLIVFETPME